MKKSTLQHLFTIIIFIFSMGIVNAQTLLKDIFPLGDGGSSPTNWSAVNDELFIFQANGDPFESNYLFASDGTEAGTIGLGPIQVDSKIIQFGDKAFFGGGNLNDGVDSIFSLYFSDGTVEGTTLFYDLEPGEGGIALGVENIVAGDSLFFFTGGTIDAGTELYRSNGTPEGTFRVADIAAGAVSGYNGDLAVIDDIAYFAGYTEEFGIEPWRSDGTPEGTYMITNLNIGFHSSFPSGFTKSGGYIYFSGLSENWGVEVRRTTGEEGNIELIGEGGGTTDSSNPGQFVDSDGRLYYVAEGDDAAGYELHVYDHVGEPIMIEPSADGDIFPRALMPFGDGEVIFNAKDAGGRELWRSDGTETGTYRIIDLYPEEMDGVFDIGIVGGSFYMCNDSLIYFAGADGVNAAGEYVFELFVSDGTEAGTQLYSDQVPGPGGTNPGHFFEHGNRIYFAATDAVVGREPYYIDKGTISSVDEAVAEIAISRAAYPNPLPQGSMLTVEMQLERNTEIQVQLYDLTGRPVQGIQNLGYYQAGNCSIQFYPQHHASGFYIVEISAGESRVNLPVFME